MELWGCVQKFQGWVDNEINKTRWEATQRVTVAKLTRLTHKIAIQLHLVTVLWSVDSRNPSTRHSSGFQAFQVYYPGVMVAQSVQWLGNGLDDQGSIPGRGFEGTLRHGDQTGSNPYRGRLPPSTGEVKIAWSYTSAPQHVFMVWWLVKHRNSFTFTPDVYELTGFCPIADCTNKVAGAGQLSAPLQTWPVAPTWCREASTRHYGTTY
jgi:hypothetical protein